MTNLEKLERKAHLDELDFFSGTEEIRLRIRDEDELFSAFDPSPLECRQVLPDAEEYLLQKVHGISLKKHVALKVTVPESIAGDSDRIADGIRNHFAHTAQDLFAANSKTRRRWRRNALLGILFLALCLVFAHVLTQISDSHPFLKVLGESLEIAGWVAVWEPASYFLYGIRDDVRVLTDHMRLHRATVEVSAESEA